MLTLNKNKGLKNSVSDDLTCLSKVLSSIDCDHAQAYNTYTMNCDRSRSSSSPTLLSPSSCWSKTSNPPSYNALAPTSLTPSHVHPTTYLRDDVLQSALEHCISVLSDGKHLATHPHFYQDTHAALHHIISLPSLILPTRPKDIEPLYRLLTDGCEAMTEIQCAKVRRLKECIIIGAGLLLVDSTFL